MDTTLACMEGTGGQTPHTRIPRRRIDLRGAIRSNALVSRLAGSGGDVRREGATTYDDRQGLVSGQHASAWFLLHAQASKGSNFAAVNSIV